MKVETKIKVKIRVNRVKIKVIRQIVKAIKKVIHIQLEIRKVRKARVFLRVILQLHSNLSQKD